MLPISLQFAVLSLGCAVAAWVNPHLWFRAFLLWTAISVAGVALIFGFEKPLWFGKTRDGRVSPLFLLILAPYHALNWGLLMGMWRRHRQSQIHQIAPNLWLSMRLSPSVARETARKKMAVVDLAAEFEESAFLRNLPHYRSIPTLDTFAPQDLREMAVWVNEQRQMRPVVVHCALGRGRSATLVVAALLQSGEAKTLAQALEIVARSRSIGLHPRQIKALKSLRLD